MRPLAFLRGVRLAADLDRLPVDILRPPERELDQPGPHRRVGHLVDQDEPAQIPIIAIALERSEEHTSELQSLMRISYAVFCLKKKKKTTKNKDMTQTRNNKQYTTI